MTENEVIDYLQDMIIEGQCYGDEIVARDDENVLKFAISSLEEIQQYKALGTVEELREILNVISEGQDDVDESGISTGLLHTLLQYAEYAKIGTVEELREAREKQRAKKVKDRCPDCGTPIKRCYFNCPGCGQAIDWQ